MRRWFITRPFAKAYVAEADSLSEIPQLRRVELDGEDCNVQGKKKWCLSSADRGLGEALATCYFVAKEAARDLVG